MKIDRIKVTLTDGSRYILKSPEKLEEVDPEKVCIFVFDTGEVYNGTTDGEVLVDGSFVIRKPDALCAIGLPFRRLIGWAYKRGGDR